MRRMLALAALLPAVSCTPHAAPPELAAATAGADAPAAECVNLDQVISRRPQKPNAIVFYLAGGKAYANHLPDHCPAIARAGEGDIVHIEATGSQLCRGDRVRIYDPVEAKNIGAQAFPHCRLGAFTPAPIVRVDR